MNINTAMRLTSMNLAIEFVQASDRDEIAFTSTKELINAAEEIYTYITQESRDDRQTTFELFDFEGKDPH